MSDTSDDVATQIETLRAERDEARAWVRRLTSTQRVLTCAFCGEAYPPGTPESNDAALLAHVKVCAKHPMRDVERERDAVVATLLARFKKESEDANDKRLAADDDRRPLSACGFEARRVAMIEAHKMVRDAFGKDGARSAESLIAAIRAITVDLPNDQPNGPAERALLDLEAMLDPSGWKWGDPDTCRRRLANGNDAMAKLCEALADDAHRLRIAAEAHFGGDFREPTAAEKVEAELEAAPGGVAVAGLLGALSAAAEEIDRVRAIGDRAERETDAFFDGEKHGLLEARKMAREHLGDPTPEQRAAAEVLALGQRYQPDSETSAADYLDHIETLASEELPLDVPWEEVRTDRDRCLWAAAMALCGIVACDAKPGGGT